MQGMYSTRGTYAGNAAILPSWGCPPSFSRDLSTSHVVRGIVLLAASHQHLPPTRSSLTLGTTANRANPSTAHTLTKRDDLVLHKVAHLRAPCDVRRLVIGRLVTRIVPRRLGERDLAQIAELGVLLHCVCVCVCGGEEEGRGGKVCHV